MEIHQLDTQISSHLRQDVKEQTGLLQRNSELPPRFCEIKLKVTHTVCLCRSRNFNSTVFLLLCHLGCLFMELAIVIQDFSAGISEAQCVALNTFSNSAPWSWESCQPLRNQLIPRETSPAIQLKQPPNQNKGPSFSLTGIGLRIISTIEEDFNSDSLYSNTCCKNVYTVALIIECYIY